MIAETKAALRSSPEHDPLSLNQTERMTTCSLLDLARVLFDQFDAGLIGTRAGILQIG
jgi:hypothetical protein